jgi:hypothetical protein
MPTTAAAAPRRAEVPAATVQHEYTATLPSATLVVQLDERRSLVRQVPLTSTTSGLALLEATGLAVAVAESSFGPVVCAIQGTGCPAEECFCDDRQFWNYSFGQKTAGSLMRSEQPLLPSMQQGGRGMAMGSGREPTRSPQTVRWRQHKG